ncbi:ATP synthase subunit epsilon, mitochondrial [Plakobranchus ocellatus]|uniref:ATP synthase subunit epsilon, mitochondrial n=1 Tax=Plakobranchus ocellatus TaxID=259542 RepID=A0AAV3YN82_9GAST|nr:ATP synthase subunit epsilon, mitochondrial [Plakobranchus ocellatus]
MAGESFSVVTRRKTKKIQTIKLHLHFSSQCRDSLKMTVGDLQECCKLECFKGRDKNEMPISFTCTGTLLAFYEINNKSQTQPLIDLKVQDLDYSPKTGPA